MRHYVIFLFVALGAAGCGSKPLPMAATPETSRATLVEVLDGWKAGKTPQEFAAASPPVLFIDDDLTRGSKLLDYTVEGDPSQKGTGYRYVVALTLEDKTGTKRAPTKVAYTVVTEPKHAVTREDR